MSASRLEETEKVSYFEKDLRPSQFPPEQNLCEEPKKAGLRLLRSPKMNGWTWPGTIAKTADLAC